MNEGNQSKEKTDVKFSIDEMISDNNEPDESNYNLDELNLIMGLIQQCTIKGSDAPVINALGNKTATMIQKIQG